MNWTRPVLVLAGLIAITFVMTVSLHSQIRPEVRRAATQTAKKVAKIGLRRILTTPLTSCLRGPEVCAEFDTAMHEELTRLIPSVQFVQREEAVRHLVDQGFLSIDAYLGALDDVASEAGAEMVISEGLARKGKSCELRATLADSKHLLSFGNVSTGIPCLGILTKGSLSRLNDPETGVSLIVTVPQPADTPVPSSPIRFPTCLRCPEPRYAGDAREERISGMVLVVVTVTERGTAENARAISGVLDSLARASVEAAQGWQFNPAIDVDGKPFSARIVVEVTFRIYP